MDEDKAIRAAKLTLGGMLEKKRAKSAVERAQGQIAPSKYLPGVPRAVHAAGGYVPQASLPVSRVAIAKPGSYGQQPTAIDALSSLASIGSTVKGFSDTVEGEEAPTGGGHHPNDGHDHSNMSEAALAAWGKLTDAYGQPLTVTSAYRDPKRNESVGGAGNSQHMHGNAYDIDTSGMSYEDRLALADMAWNSGFRGVGFYDNSLHFDVGDPRSWGPSYSRDSIPEWALPWAQERYGYADGGPVADLGQAREQKQLQTFSNNMRSDIHQRASNAMAAHQKAVAAGVFDGYEVGDTLQGSAHPMRITGRFVRKWKPTPMTLQSFDRMGAKPTIVEHEGEQYIPMLRYQTGKEGVDGFQEGDAYLDGVKAAGYQKMGGLRSVKAAGGAAMFEGIHPDLQDESGNPKDLYHGTPGAGFDEFKDTKLGSTRDHGFYGRGHYLTPDRDAAEEYTTNEYENPGTVMGPLHAALKNPYIWDTSDAGSHRTLRDLQSMGIMKGQGKLEPWDNLQRHHIDPFMREMKNRGHDGVLVKGDNGLSEVVVFKPTAIKHRDAEVFDPNDPRIMRAGGGRTMYSRAAEIIRGLPQEKGTVDQFIAAAKARGAKPSELEHAGRPEGDKITRDEMAKHFESRLPKLKIEQYGDNPSRLTRDENKRRIELQNRDQLGRGDPLTPEEKTEQERLNRRLMSSPNVLSDEETEEPLETEYGAYRLPGGQNYRERLISLQRPKDPREPLEDKLKKLTQTQNAWPEGHPARDRFDSEINELKGKLETMPPRKEPATYQSSHWAGHPNVLAHIRMQDRTLGEDRDSVRPIAEKLAAGLGIGIRDLASGAASVGIQNKIITPQEAASLSRLMGWRNGYDQAPGIGKRVLHVEELQSDWAQEGRDKGFRSKPYRVWDRKTGQTVSEHDTHDAAWDAYRTSPDSDKLDYGHNNAPPPAPYVTNTQHWTDLALKHVLHEAAHGNYDGIVFTPGQAQADRYGLEKQLDTLAYYPGSNRIAGYKDEYNVFQKDDVKPEDLAAHVGKEVAERLLDQSNARNIGTEDQVHVLQGNDLKAGGLGMKGYYDNIVPKSVMRLAQQHDPEAKAAGPVDLGEGYSGFHLPMTDTLKNSIIDKGFTAFKRGGKVDKALAITRGFTKDGRAATMQLKAKGD